MLDLLKNKAKPFNSTSGLNTSDGGIMMRQGGLAANNYNPIADEPMREDFETDKAKKLDEKLEDAFRDYYNSIDNAPMLSKKMGIPKSEVVKNLRDAYSNVVKGLYEKDPDTFREAIQDVNTDARIAALNELAFGSNPDLPYDEEIGDAAQTKLNIPFGSEGDTFLGGPTGLEGTVIQGVDEINVAGGEKYRDNVTRHEYIHLANKGEGADNVFGDTGVDDEILVRSFDYVRGLIGGDEKLKKEASDFFEQRTSLSPLKAVQIVVNSLPQLYDRGVFDRSKTTLDTAQDVVRKIDEDAQGFISSLVGSEPEAVEKPIATFPPTWKLAKNEDTEKLKELLSIIPISSDIKKETYDQKYKIDREAAEMNAGGIMMRQGGGIETEAGKEMAKEKFQLDERKADLDKDGELSAYEKARGEAVQRAMGEGKEAKMAMGGMMGGMMADPFAPLQVTVDIDEESGNEVPAGSKEEEVRDDIPAMLSEGEYVVPADVVRYHGLKKFEELRCEAKEALGLMAMHDRISFVDDETKEPVEYDIEEKDLPEVEEAEVEVVEAAEGTDVQPATEPTTFYQLQYKTDPVTGQVRIVYVDPLTGQEVKREEYEEERASRFAPQKLLEREVFTPGEEVAEEEEEEKKEPLVPLPVDDGGDGREPTPKGPTYSYTNAELDAALSKQLTTYTAPTEMEIPPALGVFSPVISAVATVVKGIGDYFTRNSALNQIRSGENLGVAPSGDYADWRNNMNNGLAGSVAITEQEAKDVVASGKLQQRDEEGNITSSPFGSIAEAQAVAEYGWGSDEVFDTIDPNRFDEPGGGQFSFEAPTQAQIDAYNEAEAARAKEEGRPGNYYSSGEDSDNQTGSGVGNQGEDDDLNVSDDDFDMNKGGYVSRKNTPRTATIKY